MLLVSGKGFQLGFNFGIYGNFGNPRLRWVFVFLLFVLLPSVGVLGPDALAQSRTGEYAQADIQYGSQIYTAQCTTCHGVNGDLISGVNFRAGQFRRVSSDFDLRTIVTNGIPGTDMPPFRFDAAELAGIVAYVRNMRDFDARGTTVVAVGDPVHGRVLFEGVGACASCHRINGKGPRLAPDLSAIGAMRSAGALQRSLLDPNGAMLPENRSVRATTRNGKVISGRRLNEDTYSVQLIDDQERLVSLAKADLREYTVIKTSSMPSYKDKFNSQELADMVAYLLSLKGAK
jgi:putative heme-binding domain-containing protein